MEEGAGGAGKVGWSARRCATRSLHRWGPLPGPPACRTMSAEPRPSHQAMANMHIKPWDAPRDRNGTAPSQESTRNELRHNDRHSGRRLPAKSKLPTALHPHNQIAIVSHCMASRSWSLRGPARSLLDGRTAAGRPGVSHPAHAWSLGARPRARPVSWPHLHPLPAARRTAGLSRSVHQPTNPPSPCHALTPRPPSLRRPPRPASSCDGCWTCMPSVASSCKVRAAAVTASAVRRPCCQPEFEVTTHVLAGCLPSLQVTTALTSSR